MIRKTSAVILALITALAVFAGCSGRNNRSNAAPYVIFGENGSQSGMTYTVEGAEKLSSGSLSGREYVKIDSKKVTVNLKLEDSEKYDGKAFYIMLEYYDSSTKSAVCGYNGKNGEVKKEIKMTGTTMWNGRSFYVDDFKSGGESDFTVSLGTSGQLLDGLAHLRRRFISVRFQILADLLKSLRRPVALRAELFQTLQSLVGVVLHAAHDRLLIRNDVAQLQKLHAQRKLTDLGFIIRHLLIGLLIFPQLVQLTHGLASVPVFTGTQPDSILYRKFSPL